MNEPTQPLDGVNFNKFGEAGPIERPKRAFQTGHFVMSLAFACFVAAWAMLQSGALDDGDIRWLLPLPWLVAGSAGLIASVVVGARRRTSTPVSH